MSAVPIAANVATPVSDAGEGVNHQKVKGASCAQSATSTPVPILEDSVSGVTGTAYSSTVTAQGGTAPYTFSVSTGSLPAGLALNSSTGAISGEPTGAGASSFTVKVTDAEDSTGSQEFSITIVAAAAAGSPNYCMVN